MQPFKIATFKSNQTRTPSTLRKDKVNVLVPIELSKYKGLDSIFHILKNSEIRKRFHFIFVYRNTPNKKKVKKLLQTNCVTLLGRITKKELANYYTYVDLTLQPSYIEGFPRHVLEAHAFRCPIIARNIVNLDRLANYVFETDKQLVNILLTKNFRRKNKINLPQEFKYSFLVKKYQDVVDSVLK